MTIRFAFQKHVPRIQTFVSPLFSADTLGDNTSSLERTGGWQLMRELYIRQTICQWLRCTLHIFVVSDFERKIETDFEKVETIAVSWRHQNRAKEEVSLINFYFLSYQQSKSVCMCDVGSWKRRPISRLTKSRGTRKKDKKLRRRYLNAGACWVW